jgi:hypothetical protein
MIHHLMNHLDAVRLKGVAVAAVMSLEILFFTGLGERQASRFFDESVKFNFAEFFFRRKWRRPHQPARLYKTE